MALDGVAALNYAVAQVDVLKTCPKQGASGQYLAQYRGEPRLAPT